MEYGRLVAPLDWGLGFELHSAKSPHWMSPDNAASAFGHFGQSGCFLWVDVEVGLACVSAGETPFGTWATEAWPRLATRVLQTSRDTTRPNPELSTTRDTERS